MDPNRFRRYYLLVGMSNLHQRSPLTLIREPPVHQCHCSGCVYADEKFAIETWLEAQTTSPTTGQEMTSTLAEMDATMRRQFEVLQNYQNARPAGPAGP